MLEFRPASKANAKLRVAFVGKPGLGKTTAAIRLANILGSKPAVIDTEGARADLLDGNHQVGELKELSPEGYASAIESAAKGGFDCVVVDSFTSEWETVKGSARNLRDWGQVGYRHEKFAQAIRNCPTHLIGTIRAKDAVSMTTDGEVVQAGEKSVQRAGFEAEFDVVCWLTEKGVFKVTKSRFPSIDGATFNDVVELGKILKDELGGATDGFSAMIENARNEEELRKIASVIRGAALGSGERQALQAAYIRKSSELGAH